MILTFGTSFCWNFRFEVALFKPFKYCPISVASEFRHQSELTHQESDEIQDTRNLRDEDLKSLALESSQRRLANVSSMPHLSRVSSINLTMLTGNETGKKKKGRSLFFFV